MEGKAYIPLPVAECTDKLTDMIDVYIKKYANCRSVAASTFVYVVIDTVTASWTPKMLSWRTVFEQVEKNNLNVLRHVTMDYFIKKLQA